MVAAAKNGVHKRKPISNKRQAELKVYEDAVYNTLMYQAKQAGRMSGNQSPEDIFSRSGRGARGTAKAIRLEAECGYPEPSELTPHFYMQMYRRQGLASRVVNIWPDETWASHPEIYESEEPETTPWETAVEDVFTKTLAFHYIHRADRLSRVGRFGILFLGLDDGNRLDRAPTGINYWSGEGKWQARKLLYVRAFAENSVTIAKKDDKKGSPRYGMPLLYDITIVDDETNQVTDTTEDISPGKTIRVHWTRIIHLAEQCIDSEIYAAPSLEAVVDYLHDARKVLGGAAEMFWNGGFPGFSFEQFPDMVSSTDLDDESLQETMEAYRRGLRRYLATEGGSWKALTPQVANPDKHLQWIIRMISVTLHVPIRVLVGSEAGQLASTQDDSAWRQRCTGRQLNYLEPRVLRPFIDRLITLGVLPIPKANKGKYIIEWRDLRSLSDDARVGVALKKVQALMSYVTGQANYVLPMRFLYTLVMGFTEKQADEIELYLKKNPAKPLGPTAVAALKPPVAATPGGGRNNTKPARGKVGSPGSSSTGKSKGLGRPASSSKRGRKQ